MEVQGRNAAAGAKEVRRQRRAAGTPVPLLAPFPSSRPSQASKHTGGCPACYQQCVAAAPPVVPPSSRQLQPWVLAA